MRVLILGSTGFLGMHLLNQLKVNKSINILSISKTKKIINRKINHKILDLNNINKFSDIVKDFKPDTCIDLSWSGIPDYSKKNNLKNFHNKKKIYGILNINNCKKIISIGSCWEYGNLLGKLEESITGTQINNFALYKLKSLQYLRELNQKNKMKFIWARVFFVYGPGNKKTSLLPSFYNDTIANKTFEIKNKLIANDFVYVTDVTRAILMLSFNNVDSGIYNVGSGNLVSNIDFCNKIHQIICGKNYFHDKLDKHYGFYAHLQKITKKTKWKPVISLEKGIKLTIDSYKNL